MRPRICDTAAMSAPEPSLPEVAIFTDGAASPNPGPGGYGVVMLRGGRREEFSAGFCATTNNRMEILGAVAGLRALGAARSNVTIYSDSRYLVDMFNGGHAMAWRRNGWRRSGGREPALNPDLWGALLDLAAHHQVRFVWVRGHAGHVENTRCDALAVAARQAADLPPDEGYGPARQPEQLTLF